MNLRCGTAAALLALALISGYGLHPQAAARCETWRGLAAVPRHPRDGRRRRLCAARLLGHREEPGRRLEDGDPGTRALEPDCLGRPHLRQHVNQRQEGRRPEGRAVRRRQAGPRRHRTRVARLLPRQEDRRRPLAADGAEGRPQDQASHQGVARELHARHRRRTPDRLLRVGGALRVRPQGQAALEEGPRRARWRLVHRPVGAVGNRQLPHPPRQRRRHPGRRAEGFVPRRVRRPRPAGVVARREERRADVGHADRAPGEGPDAAHRQRLAAHWRLRLQDRQGNLEADRRRRHPRADARRRTTA